MKKEETFITVNHLDDYEGPEFFRVGETLTLKKDRNNDFDDEAIVVYKGQDHRCGYVANSVSTVARGTCSAGRLYDQIEDEQKCLVRFIFAEEGVLIAQIL